MNDHCSILMCSFGVGSCSDVDNDGLLISIGEANDILPKDRRHLHGFLNVIDES